MVVCSKNTSEVLKPTKNIMKDIIDEMNKLFVNFKWVII